MDSKQFADTYLMANGSNFPAEKIHVVKDKLINMPEDRQSSVQALSLKNPVVVLILSLLFGTLAIDRFYLGDIGLGILKILSLFIFVGFIWALADIYLCYKKSKEVNFNKLVML